MPTRQTRSASAQRYSQNLEDSQSFSNLSGFDNDDVVNDPAFSEEENPPEIVIRAPKSYEDCARFYNQSIKPRLTCYLDETLKSYFVTVVVITLHHDGKSITDHDLPCVIVLYNPDLDPQHSMSNFPNELFDSDNGEDFVCIIAEGEFQYSNNLNSSKRNRKYMEHPTVGASI